jgi:G3E family GTPase
MSEAHQPVGALPIVLITGYLGSGKTTFLNRLLATAQGRRFAVLVNDFGAINVDEKLIEGAVDGVVALENGCICCSLEGGLHSAIVRVLRAGERPEAILIEASGVSNAGELVRILNDEAMQGYTSLEMVVSTFDCDHWQTCSQTERDLIQSQLRHANVILLTKTDLVSAGQRAAALGFMQAAAPGALVIGAITAEVTLDLLLGDQLRGPVRQPPEAGSAPLAQDLFSSWQVRESEPFTKAGFQALLTGLPPETVRGKGYVHLAEFPATRFLLQMVGKRASVVPSGDWGQNAPQTELVFIALRRQGTGSGADYSLT